MFKVIYWTKGNDGPLQMIFVLNLLLFYKFPCLPVYLFYNFIVLIVCCPGESLIGL